MKLCVTKKDTNLIVVKTNCKKTTGCIGHLPSNTPVEDFQFVVECPVNRVKICQKKKSEWMKEQIKNANI